MNFDLTAGTVVQGHVTRDGKPVTSAEVAFASADPGGEIYSSASVDDRGAYEAKGLAPGKYNVSVTEKIKYTRIFAAIHEVTGSESYDIDIKSTSVRGRVVDAAMRAVDLTIPSADLTIALTPGGTLVIQSSAADLQIAQLLDASGAVHLLSPYSIEGKFRVDAGTTTINNIESGSYTVRIFDRKGAVESTVPAIIKEGETTHLNR